jgi:hypothetical protein
MKSASSFLLASRQCEITELEQLARRCELVSVIARFIHALQRERGTSNVFLGSQGARFADERAAQVAACESSEREVRTHFDLLDTEPGHVHNGSRLFNGVALVLHAMDGLAELRAAVAQRRLRAPEATAAYGRLVAGLLGVVFEAADSATDPQVSRALVAMFNFMQGKEFAGQERAFGARVFAAGYIDASGQQQWRHLVDSQRACFEVFADFADAENLQADQASQEPAVAAEIERLRRLGCHARAGPLDANLSHDWFELCTRRMDAMKLVEDFLALHLRRLCTSRIEQALAELHDQRATLDGLLHQATPVATSTPAALGPHLDRSVLAMVQAQSRRLQEMGDELESVRATLQERKLIERAKGLLMAHRQLSEDDAYKALRQMAMNHNRRIVDVAGALLSLSDVLPSGAR